MDSSLRTLIIVPCFNEGKRLPLEEFQKFLTSNSKSTIFLFVNDGSKDNTLEVLNSIQQRFPESTRVLNLEINSGKAEAVRQGMLSAIDDDSFDYVGFMDADLATPLSEIEEIYKSILKYNQPSIVFGSRVKLFGSTKIERSSSRHYIGRIIATMISNSLKLGIYDTQCGFKFIRQNRIKELFAEKFSSRWLFDVEILFRMLSISGYSKINEELFEHPVSIWTEKGDSKIPLTYAFQIPFELYRIRKKYASKLKN